MKRLTLAASAALLSAGAILAFATGPSPSGVARASGSADALTVVELFTSQSCYSCPPAEAFLGELVGERSDLLALEWHVDYWDSINYGSAGRWKDLFADPAYTERQRVYNSNIRGRNSVYTPQMIIGGVEEAVGSRRDEVLSAVTKASLESPAQVNVRFEQDDQGIDLVLDGTGSGDAVIWLVRFDVEHLTKVLRGENHGKTLSNHHVVRHVERVGDWQGEPVTVSLGALGLEPNQGCAVLVQDADQGPILGAARCPTGQSS